MPIAYFRVVDAVAVFDLDNTLVRGSSLFHFGKALVREGLLSARHLVPFVLAEGRYARGSGEKAGMPDRVAACVLGLVRGREASQLRQLADRWTPGFLASHGIASSLTAMADLQAHGYTVVIATASPQELADAFAAVLGAHGAIGTQGETRDGRYTGLLAAPVAHGLVKRDCVLSWLGERGLDPARCWAFSDSANDLPMLNAVGHPVVVNADGRLLDIAVERGWQVLGAKSQWPGLCFSAPAGSPAACPRCVAPARAGLADATSIAR